MNGKTTSRNLTLYKECGIALAVWLLILIFLLAKEANSELIGYLVLIFPYAIFLYLFLSLRVIPRIVKKKQDYRIYLLQVIFIIALTIVPIVTPTSKIARGLYLNAGVFSLIFQFVFTAPFTWEVYHRRLRSGKEIFRLKKELDRADANYQFLQSQINPHFLFNALNT